LLGRETAKEPQLHNAGLPGVQPGKIVERIIESDEFHVPGRKFYDLLERKFVSTIALAGTVSSRIIHQNLASAAMPLRRSAGGSEILDAARGKCWLSHPLTRAQLQNFWTKIPPLLT
jgi:hypothetical protein